MTIGIDLDNTLVDTQTKMYEFIYSDERKEDLLKNIEALTTGNTKNEMVKYFYKKYATKIFETAELIIGTKEAIDYLVKTGHRVVFITLRGDKNKMYASSEIATIKYLEEHKIPFSNIIFNSKNKVQDCKTEKIDIMLDDSLRTIARISKTSIKGVLFNPSGRPNYGCSQVANWQEFIDMIKEIS